MPYSRNTDKIFVLVIAILCIILYFLPTGFPTQDDDYVRSKAKVTAVDNQAIHQRGVVQTGVQAVSVQVVGGEFAGQEFEATNTLLGKLEMDKYFSLVIPPWFVIKGEHGRIIAANLIDHYRLDQEALLFGLFILALFWFARWTGVKPCFPLFLPF